MNKELCIPCIKPEINKPVISKIKSLIYIEQNSNVKDLMDSYYNKNCRPNLKAELGNDSYKTATDRFNINDHQKTNEQLVNIQPIVPEIINFD